MRVRLHDRRQRPQRGRREAQAGADRRGVRGGVGIRMSSDTEPMTTTDEGVALEQLYADFAANNLMPLWTVRGDLMPKAPSPHAVPQIWRWADVLPIAERAGALVPVGRGGDRRAIAYANVGLKPEPY